MTLPQQDALDAMAAMPHRRFTIGRFQFATYRFSGHLRWECSNGTLAVGGYRTPVGACMALRRFRALADSNKWSS